MTDIAFQGMDGMSNVSSGILQKVYWSPVARIT